MSNTITIAVWEDLRVWCYEDEIAQHVKDLREDYFELVTITVQQCNDLTFGVLSIEEVMQLSSNGQDVTLSQSK